MPIDPRIPLQAQTAQIPPFDVAKPLVTMAQLRRMQTEQTMAEAQLADTQRQREEQATMRDIFRRNVTPDPQTGQPTMNRLGAIGELYGVNPALAMQMEHQTQTETLAREKATRENQAAQWKQLKEQNALVSNVAQWVKTQGTQDAWDAGVAHLEAQGVTIPPQYKGVYNAQALEQLIGLTQDNDARLEQALKTEQIKEAQYRVEAGPRKEQEDIRQFEASQATTRRGQEMQKQGALAQAAAVERAGELAYAGVVNKPLEGPAAQRAAGLEDAIALTTDVLGLYRPEYVGPWEGRTAAIREKWTGEMKAAEVEFRRSIKDIQSAVRLARTGAAVGQQREYNDLLALVPDETLPDEVFRARAQSFLKAAARLRDTEARIAVTRRKDLQGTAPSPSEGPPTPAAPTGAAKTVSRADAQALATRHNRSLEQVMQDLKAKGYTVE